MPLSSSIMKRIWPKELRATVFHVTNATGYRSIKKMQGKKSGISAFFEMRGSYFEQGSCTPDATTTSTLNSQLFGGNVINSSELGYFFCIKEETGNSFTIIALEDTSSTTKCQLTLGRTGSETKTNC